MGYKPELEEGDYLVPAGIVGCFFGIVLGYVVSFATHSVPAGLLVGFCSFFICLGLGELEFHMAVRKHRDNQTKDC